MHRTKIDRRQLLKTFDVLDRKIDQTGLMAGLDSFDQQAIDLILGRAKEAFNLQREDPRVRDRYSVGTAGLGDQLLLGRRLCEAGCGFVTLHYANSNQGWDMHNKMLPQLQQACPPLDRAMEVVPGLLRFLRQNMNESMSRAETLKRLGAVVKRTAGAA